MKFIINLIQTALNIFLFAILPIVVFTLLSSKTGIIAGIRSFVVLTGSMQPQIPVGSIVYTLPSSRYEAGDIIAFTKNEVTVTHRIIAIKTENGQTMYQTQGDANNVADTDLVAPRDVIGRMEVQFPGIGRVIGWLRTLPGFLLGVVMPGIVVIIFEILAIKRELEKEIRKKVMAQMQGTN